MEVRADFDCFAERRYRTVTVRGKEVRIQNLSEFERSAIEVDAPSDLRDLRARLIAACIVDADGDRIFSSGQGDIDFIASWDSAVAVPISDAINQHCEAAELEELVKN